jgi:sugar phosphate isomerase/epimerase
MNMKNVIAIVLFFIHLNLFSQDKAMEQKSKLLLYMGTWFSADYLSDTVRSINPKIKVITSPKLNGNSLQVEVFEKQNNQWVATLVELISYDTVTNQIVAAGQNQKGECFVGKGLFDINNQWTMQDSNFKGEPTLNVTFNFISSTEVILKGELPDGTKAWEVKYIKDNPKDKNIGLQLVSVRYAMEKDPVKTIQQLGRMGFSFVETFVYNDGKFYGMTPLEFKKLLNENGLQFTGSMVFKNLPNANNWKETMQWWEKCIKDHKEAGVEYITTSNNEIKNIKSIQDLDKFVQYYNTVGKLCKQNGIIFGFHNHQGEFLKVDDQVILDYWLQHTNPKYVQFQSDLYWMKIGGVNPIDYYKKYSGKFFSWHVKDDAELGQSGTTDFGAIFKYVRQSGLKYTLVEVENFNYDPLLSVEMGYHYLYDSDFVPFTKETKF